MAPALQAVQRQAREAQAARVFAASDDAAFLAGLCAGLEAIDPGEVAVCERSLDGAARTRQPAHGGRRHRRHLQGDRMML